MNLDIYGIPEYSHKILILSHGYICYRHQLRGDILPNGNFARKMIVHNEYGPASFNRKTMNLPRFLLNDQRVDFNTWAAQSKMDPEQLVWYKLHYV